ncbi:hypothetical protein BH09SUM1_BH09SUM1_04440 [soil metagenome]
MIAFFVSDMERAAALSRLLSQRRQEVDGPFQLYRGKLRGSPAAVYAVSGNSDLSYAAAALAARRGATVLVAIAECSIGEPVAEQVEIAPGAALPVSAIHDLRALAPLLRLLPNSADVFPLELGELLPEAAQWTSAVDGVAVGTLPWRCENPFLAAALHRERGIALLDMRLSGYADGAADFGVELRPIAIVSEVLRVGEVIAPVGLQALRNYEELIGAMLG